MDDSQLYIKQHYSQALSATFHANKDLLEEILELPIEYARILYSQELILGPQGRLTLIAEERFGEDYKIRSKKFQKAIQWSIAFPAYLGTIGLSSPSFLKMAFHSSEINICYQDELGGIDHSLTALRIDQMKNCKSYRLRFAVEKNGYSLHETIGKWFSSALMGLSVRDMISDPQSRFSEKDYFFLTAAYRFFFGKIHPEDEEIESLDELYMALGVPPMPTDY